MRRFLYICLALLPILLAACSARPLPAEGTTAFDLPAEGTTAFDLPAAETATADHDHGHILLRAATAVTETPYDYGRARTGEYVYRMYNRYHEIDCPLLYGDIAPVYLDDALEEGLLPSLCCVELGKSASCDFPLNNGFARSMKVQRKVNMVSDGGASVHDIVFTVSGDNDFDINSNFINYTCRLFFREFRLNPADIKVLVRTNSREYHNIQCTRLTNVTDINYIYLPDAFEQNMTACSTCSPPLSEQYTMPVNAIDDAHYFYATPAYIRRVMNGGIPDPTMNIDVDKMLAGFYDADNAG